jgi:hypothetical protein
MVFDDYLEGESEERTLELATNVTIRGDTKIKCYRREHSLLKFVRAAHKGKFCSGVRDLPIRR